MSKESPSRLSDGLATAQELETLLDMTAHPGWKMYMQTVQADLDAVTGAIWVVQTLEGIADIKARKDVLEKILGLRDSLIGQIDEMENDRASDA